MGFYINLDSNSTANPQHSVTSGCDLGALNTEEPDGARFNSLMCRFAPHHTGITSHFSPSFAHGSICEFDGDVSVAVNCARGKQADRELAMPAPQSHTHVLHFHFWDTLLAPRMQHSGAAVVPIKWTE